MTDAGCPKKNGGEGGGATIVAFRYGHSGKTELQITGLKFCGINLAIPELRASSSCDDLRLQGFSSRTILWGTFCH